MLLSDSVLERINNRDSVSNLHLVNDYDTFLKWIAWLVCEDGNEEGK